MIKCKGLFPGITKWEKNYSNATRTICYVNSNTRKFGVNAIIYRVVVDQVI